MKHSTISFVALIALMGIGQASAATLSFGFGSEFSGAEAPQGAAPWLTATFDDDGTTGTVELTIESTNLTGNEFVGEWLFNLDPTLDPTALMFSTTSTMGSFIDPAVHTGVDAFNAGGGLYDIQFDFAIRGGSDARFGAGDKLVTDITGISTLSVWSFSHNFKSTPRGSSARQFWSAAHIQGIGDNDRESGWITAPEPSSIALWVIGLFSMLVFVFRSGSGLRLS